jgi:hypothetical protein
MAQSEDTFDLIAAIESALELSAQVQSAIDQVDRQRIELSLHGLETGVRLEVQGPRLSARVDKRFSDPNAGSPYAPRELSWSGNIGVGASRATDSGGRLGVEVASRMSVSNYGAEVLQQVPSLSFSWTQPIFVDGQVFNQEAFSAWQGRLENDVRYQELWLDDTRNRVARDVLYAYLNTMNAKEQIRLQNLRRTVLETLLREAEGVERVLVEREIRLNVSSAGCQG